MISRYCLKAFSTLEGVIRVLDPEVSLMEVATPIAQRYFLAHLSVEVYIEASGLRYTRWYQKPYRKSRNKSITF